MAKWTFEPGHTATEFRARHMMVTYVPPCTALRSNLLRRRTKYNQALKSPPPSRHRRPF